MRKRLQTFLKEYPHAWTVLYFVVYISWFVYLEQRARLPYHVIHFPLDDYIPFCEYFVLEYDWKLMMHYIKEYDEAYYETAVKYENEQCYFACNIFIMRRKYFDEMCAFIFGVLEKVDGYYRNLPMVRKDRYLGYLVENLLSIYMMHNAKRLKAAYTDMKFYPCLE